MLVELVARRVCDSHDERGTLPTESAQKQEPEQGVLGGVRGLPEHEVPRSEPRAEVGNRGEHEDQSRPRDDW